MLIGPHSNGNNAIVAHALLINICFILAEWGTMHESHALAYI